ncbi:MAG: aminodeoxychorismate synthase component I [Gemmatimonadetes bacterium]|nr:aminodeoxychorismate synthase component I [Gemmatimonadota bacterium]
MDAARVILDFPGPARNRERIDPGPPRRIIEAHRLADVLPALQEAERAAAAGAWVAGFVAYEAAPAFDAALCTRPHEGPLPLLWFAVFDSTADGRAADRTTHLRNAAPSLPQLRWTPDVSRAEYDGALRSIREAIAAGDVYQVNHTLRFRAACDVAPINIYNALSAARHGRYHALIETPGWAIVSASPELFVDVRDGIVTTRPMKGTARRGLWSADDDDAAARLAASTKDRAENLMIVDLLRNDLGRVARFGSVTVHDMFAVETYPTVHQMTSTITARLRADVSLSDIFGAAFPCGSVTGAPKIAAMQRIAALEQSPRGAYCGAIGVLRPDGSATFSVAIRTLVIDRSTSVAVYGAGGGITWDSVADAEYDEVVAKAALLAGTDAPAFDLLETMRLEDGRLRRLDLHLERLTSSARYWGFPPDAGARAAALLRRLQEDTPAGVWRVRMTVSRDAHVSITRVRIDDDGGVDDRGSDASALPVVVLADTPVDSRDPLLHHKTTARAVYDTRRAAYPDAFDVLLHNEHGCITEFTIGNVVCEIDGERVTPPRAAGLLGGTFREQLLRTGAVREADVGIADLSRVTRMWLVNSVKESVQVRLKGSFAAT